jgi:hypothetical protein
MADETQKPEKKKERYEDRAVRLLLLSAGVGLVAYGTYESKKRPGATLTIDRAGMLVMGGYALGLVAAWKYSPKLALGLVGLLLVSKKYNQHRLKAGKPALPYPMIPSSGIFVPGMANLEAR